MPKYVDVAAAREATGLRLVLTEGVPGPWGEAAKGLFHAKNIAFVAVRQEGGGENSELAAWTGHANAPQAIYNDEPARCGWSEIVLLAERLAPEPSLLPPDPRERATMFGLLHEIAGEMGLGWCRRLMMIDPGLKLPADALGPMRAIFERLGDRYGYSSEAAARAEQRVIDILQVLAAQWQAQREAGHRFLIGDQASALDLYWAAFAALLSPLPPDACPMPEGLRQQYGTPGPRVEAALDPALLDHRDAIYRDFLQLPMDF